MDYSLFYMKAARNYNFSRLDEGEVFDQTLKYIEEHLCSKDMQILDVGCGTGEYGYALKQRGYSVKGIDKSSSQIEIASKRICAQRGDVLSLLQKSNSVDAILMIMMVHQLKDYEIVTAFAEVVRVLKHGGVVIIKTCFEEDILKRITSQYFPSCLRFDRMRYPSKECLVSANRNLTLCCCDKISINTSISKERLIQKFRSRGASNIGMLSNEELEQGISRLLDDYSNKDDIELNFDNTFLVFECRKKVV